MIDAFHWPEFMMGIGAGLILAGVVTGIAWWLK